MTRRPVLEFWYEFASTYSYLAAMRVEELAETLSKAGTILGEVIKGVCHGLPGLRGGYC